MSIIFRFSTNAIRGRKDRGKRESRLNTVIKTFEKNDLPVLEKIKAQEWMFADLNPEPLTKEMITRVI